MKNRKAPPLLKSLFLIFLIFTAAAPVHGQGGDSSTASPQAFNQDLLFDHLTKEDGLSSNGVLSLLQDSNGFMWIGTFNGLNRYDGHTVIVYKNDLNDPNSLSSNIIRAIAEDEQGILWIATSNGGLNRFDPATQTFSHYLNDPENPNSLSDNSIISLYAADDGILWLGTQNNGLDRFDPATETFSRYPELGGGSVERIFEDRASNLWIVTFGGGLAKLNPETGQVVTRYQHDPENPASLSTDKVRYIYEDTAGNIWIAAHDGGLDRLVPESGNGQPARFIHHQYDPNNPYGVPDGLITRIFEDSSGTLWVGGQKGLAKFEPQTGNGQNARFTPYVHIPTNPHSLSHNVITAFTEDQAGILWFGTLGGGVSRHNPATQRFGRYRHFSEDQISLGGGGIKAAYVDAAGDLWLGISDDGLDKVDRTSGQITHYRHNPENPHSLSGNRVQAIYEDRAGIFWVGNLLGLDRFDRANEQFRQMHDSRIVTIYEDSARDMWFGTINDGLLRFDRETEQFQAFTADPDKPDSLSDKAVSAILEDRTGAFWVGTWNGGLNLFDRDTGRVRVFRHNPKDIHSLSNDRVEVLYEDQAGRLWIGTAIGVNRFNHENETFTHYTDRDGLSDSYVQGILEEAPADGAGGVLWFNTKKGIARFDPLAETFQNYDASHGLQGNASDRGHFKSASGEMFFGSETGLTTFYPDQITNNPYIPPVVLTNLKLLNRTVPIDTDSPLQQAIWETEHLTLSYEDDIITFEFTALSYTTPEENLLQYKMEGFDDDWSPAGTSHSATYTNLDPGDYVFRVRGSNSDGVWNEAGTALRLTITPPWWQTTRFRGLVLVLLIGLTYGAYRWRVSSIKARSRELEQEVVDKTRDLQVEISERKKTEQRLRRARDELTTVMAVSQDVVSTLDLDTLLKLILEKLRQVVAYDGAGILTFKDEALHFRAYQGMTLDSRLGSLIIPTAGVSPMRQVVFERQSFIINDIWQEPGLSQEFQAATGLRMDQLFGDAYAWMGMPLTVGDKAIGLLGCIHREPGFYQADDLRLAETFANQVAIALENAQLYEQAQAAAVAEERNRLARDLHDSVTQSIYSASLVAEVLPEIWRRDPDEAEQGLEDLQHLTRGALAEMRTMLLELRPASLLKTPLGDLLKQLAEAATNRTDIKPQLDIAPVPALPPEVHIDFYRVAQEALNNMVKHSQASEVSLGLLSSPPLDSQPAGEWQGHIELRITDDGQGFDPSKTSTDSLGLGIMRERAEEIKATLTIDSVPGKGTSVTLVWEKE